MILEQIPLKDILLVLIVLAIFILTLLRESIWDSLTVSVQFREHYNSSFQNIKSWLAYRLHRSEIRSSAVPHPEDCFCLFSLSSHVSGRLGSKGNSYGKTTQKLRGDPAPGSTFFKYRGCWFRVMITVEPDTRSSTSSTATLRISSFKWNSQLLATLLKEAVDAGVAGGKANKTTVFGICETFRSWQPVGTPKSKRSTSTVFLKQGQIDQVIKDVQSFWDSRKWYEDRNIPHRRGYLLYGPPGCGKTSMVRAIAGKFQLDICSLSLSSKGLTDSTLMTYLNKTPINTLILIEDVDCAFKSRQDFQATTAETNLVLAGTSGSAVTFHGLLNALDGVASCDGKITFLTTNHPEKLDPALTRPGRVDVKVMLDYPEDEQLGRFFSQFYPQAEDHIKAQVLSRIKSLERSVSMAMIQGLFMMHKEDAQEAVDGCQVYFEEQFRIMPKLDEVNANLYL